MKDKYNKLVDIEISLLTAYAHARRARATTVCIFLLHSQPYRSKDFQRIEGVKSSRLIVIAAEGRATENIYFEAMRQELCATNVQLVVLNRDDDNSNPANVHRQIKEFMEEYNILDDDQLWIVVDRDDWKEKMLADIAQLCQQNSNLRFCMSNPCFELWLILHLEDITAYSEEDKKNLFENPRLSTHGTWTK